MHRQKSRREDKNSPWSIDHHSEKEAKGKGVKVWPKAIQWLLNKKSYLSTLGVYKKVKYFLFFKFIPSSLKLLHTSNL